MLQNPLNAFLPEDQAQLILVMFVSIPLSYILSLIYNKYLLLALTMTITMSFQSLLFPEDKWLLWGQQQIVYLLILYCPRSYVGHIVTFQSFLLLSCAQLGRMYNKYGINTFDVTGILMMQLFNYIGLAYNYQNGAKAEQRLSKEQLARRVVETPKYLTYLGYVNFLPACLVGPTYEYCDFEHYLNRTGDFVSIPSTIKASLTELGYFILSLLAYFALSHFNIERVLTEEFEQYSYGYRLLYMVICITYIELKYVTAWSLGMVSMRASGFTYNPTKNKVVNDQTIVYDFGRVQVNGVMKFYFDPNMKIKTDNWNISIQQALRRYIYENIYNAASFTDEKKRKARQSFGQIATVLVSALWHGLYPGYYVSFFHWILYVQIIQQVYRIRKIEGTIIFKIYQKYPSIAAIIQNASSTFVMTYFGMAFHLMTWDRVWIYLKLSYFIPYVLLYVFFIAVVQLKILTPKKKKTQNIEETKKD